MSTFFAKFKPIEYTLEGYTKQAMNIITAAILRRLNVDKNYVFQKYIIKDGQTPDLMSEELYNDSTWAWTAFLVNGIVDPYSEWPMDQNTLENFIVSEYGSPDLIHEFRFIDSGWILDDIQDRDCRQLIADGLPLPINVTPVTTYQYEFERNNRRREITVISPKYIRKFVDTFNRSLEQ